MITFEVDDMTCGHCVSSITQAVHAVDQGAQVTVDLATHRVAVEPTGANQAQRSDAVHDAVHDAIRDAIRDAGFSPVPVEDGAASVARSATRSGCCCR